MPSVGTFDPIVAHVPSIEHLQTQMDQILTCISRKKGISEDHIAVLLRVKLQASIQKEIFMANNNETRYIGDYLPQQYQVINEILHLLTVPENGGHLVHLGPDQGNMMLQNTQQVQATAFTDTQAELGSHAECTSWANPVLSSLFCLSNAPYFNPTSGLRAQGFYYQPDEVASGTFDPQGHSSFVPEIFLHSRPQQPHDQVQLLHGTIEVRNMIPMVPQRSIPSGATLVTQSPSGTNLPRSSVKPQPQQDTPSQKRRKKNHYQGNGSHNISLPNQSSANEVIHIQGSTGHNLSSPNPSVPPKGQKILNLLYDPVYEKHGKYADPSLRAFVESEFFDKYHHP